MFMKDIIIEVKKEKDLNKAVHDLLWNNIPNNIPESSEVKIKKNKLDYYDGATHGIITYSVSTKSSDETSQNIITSLLKRKRVFELTNEEVRYYNIIFKNLPLLDILVWYNSEIRTNIIDDGEDSYTSYGWVDKYYLLTIISTKKDKKLKYKIERVPFDESDFIITNIKKINIADYIPIKRNYKYE